MVSIFRKQIPPPQFSTDIGFAMLDGLGVESLLLYSTLDENRTGWSEMQEAVPSLATETEIKDFTEFFLEELAFGLNCVDRILNAKVGGKLKGPVLESVASYLVANVANCLARELELSPEDFNVSGLSEMIVNRQTFYGALAFPKRKGPLAGTLFWEYGKYLSFRCSVVNPIIIAEMSKHGMSTFQFLRKVVSLRGV